MAKQIDARAGAIPEEDVWIPSHCALCYSQCGIKVHRVNGTVVKIEGNPDSPVGLGRLCAKGLSGIQLLYDPYRVNYPLRRTNPQKGLDVDPKWERITWDEALDIVTERLRRVLEDDPRKLITCGTVMPLGEAGFAYQLFANAFGTPNTFISNGHHCGTAEHTLAVTMHGGAITTNPDLDYCDYVILFGTHMGFGAYYAVTTMTQRMADARARGMKVVTVDPYLSTAAEKADEWLPIRPGTDGALALAMLNLLVNEYGTYDADYLKQHTDAPYLLGPDGMYLRDEVSQKPLIWDSVAKQAKLFDDETIGDFALEGSYRVNGVESRPVFQQLKDHVRKWTPEVAANLTSIPVETIRRVAREFGEAARIGSTITIDGYELPYRPAAALYFKGAHGHDNAWPTAHAIELLNEVVGASNLPGSLMGCNPVSFGHPETGKPRWGPKADPVSGLLRGWGYQMMSQPDDFVPPPWPANEPKRPANYNLTDFNTWSLGTCMPPLTMRMADRFGFDYKPEVLLNYGSNLIMSVAQPEVSLEAFKDCFVISFNIFIDETAEALADIVLPDASYLERLYWMPNTHRHHFPVGMGDWGYGIRQPIVKPMYERRDFKEVIMELADRLGILSGMYSLLNMQYGLRPPYLLNPEERYTLEEIADRVYKNWFGEEHGLEWFKEHGVIKWPKKVEEVYWKAFVHARTPLYVEWMVPFGKQADAVLRDLGLNGEADTSTLAPLPNWHPCQASLCNKPGYDLKAIYYRVPFHSFSLTYENPWLDEISRMEPYSYFIAIHPKTAMERHLRDGDLVWVESADAGRTQGRLKLTEGIHPEVIAIANNGGHWAKGMPFAKGKGVQFNRLIPFDLKHTDLACNVIDCDARVRVYKA